MIGADWGIVAFAIVQSVTAIIVMSRLYERVKNLTEIVDAVREDISRMDRYGSRGVEVLRERQDDNVRRLDRIERYLNGRLGMKSEGT